MINTIVKGQPYNPFWVCKQEEIPKITFVVRTFYLKEKDMYVTDVYELQPEKYFPVTLVTIPADSKEEVIKRGNFDHRCYHQHICNHRPFMFFAEDTNFEYSRANLQTPKYLAELHFKVCQEIINGKYWFGGWAIP